MTIDMHSHWKSNELADAMRARTVPPRIVRVDDGTEMLDGRFGIEPLNQVFDDVEVRLDSMDRQGITMAMLSMQPGFGWMERLPIDEALPLVSRYNDAVSRTMREARRSIYRGSSITSYRHVGCSGGG